MVSFSLEDIKERVDELALKINAPSNLLPTYGYSRDGAYPHIEVDGAGFMHYVIVERGKELNRKTTNNLDTLLYWIFAGVTFSMSVDFAAKNRTKGKDSRRLMFSKQEKLLGVMNDAWRLKEMEEHQQILKNYPLTIGCSVCPSA